VPSLRSPDFSKYFLLYTFASDHSLATVLTQKYDQGDKFLVAFMSTGLQGVELNYPLVEKQAFSLHKEIKQFRSYILKKCTKFIVPHPEVRSMFVQKELGERRGNWITSLQEYDLEFKPTNIIKGQGLCKLVTKEVDAKEQEDDGWKDEQIMYTQQVSYVPTIEGSSYNDIKYYLQHGTTPDHLNAKKRRELRLKYLQYRLLHGILFIKNYDKVLLRCLEKQEFDKVLKDMHDGPTGVHLSGDTTTHKLLRAGYYWPTLFKDAHAYSRSCDACQK
jgi:hypothetical protein